MATQLFNDAAVTTIATLNDAHYVNIVNNTTGKLQKITVANLKVALGAPLMSFGVLLSQSGTGAPTQTVVFNNTGATFSYSRNGAGDYDLVASSTIFPAGGMIISALNGQSILGAVYGISRVDSSTLNILCSGDDILSSCSIKVEIYV